MRYEPAEAQVGGLQGRAQIGALAGHTCVGLGALLALAGFGAPWSSSLGGFFQVGGLDFVRFLLADPVATVRNWGAWNAGQLVMLPGTAALLLLTAVVGATVVAAPTLVPAQRRSLLGFLHQGLPLYQLLVAAMLGWGVAGVLVPLLVSESASLGAGLPIMLMGAGLAGAGACGALLVSLSQVRVAATPTVYAAAA